MDDSKGDAHDDAHNDAQGTMPTTILANTSLDHADSNQLSSIYKMEDTQSDTIESKPFTIYRRPTDDVKDDEEHQSAVNGSTEV